MFVDLEKVFDKIPTQEKVLWWSMRKLGIHVWIISTFF